MMTEKQLKALATKIRSYQKALKQLDRIVESEWFRTEDQLVKLAGSDVKSERVKYKKLETYKRQVDRISELFSELFIL